VVWCNSSLGVKGTDLGNSLGAVWLEDRDLDIVAIWGLEFPLKDSMRVDFSKVLGNNNSGAAETGW
jgi:hypothetical protein